MLNWLEPISHTLLYGKMNNGVWNEGTYNPNTDLGFEYKFKINFLSLNSANILHSYNDQGGLYSYTTTPYIDKTIATIVWTTISIIFFFSVAIVYSKTDFK
jgi:hypothetical protein